MKELISSYGISIFEVALAIISFVVLILLYTALSKNLPNVTWNFNIGLSMKWNKKYRCGDIFEILGHEWYLDEFAALRINFRLVVEWNEEEKWVKLHEKETLSIAYVTWIHMMIHKLGTCKA